MSALRMALVSDWTSRTCFAFVLSINKITSKKFLPHRSKPPILSNCKLLTLQLLVLYHPLLSSPVRGGCLQRLAFLHYNTGFCKVS